MSISRKTSKLKLKSNVVINYWLLAPITNYIILLAGVLSIIGYLY